MTATQSTHKNRMALMNSSGHTLLEYDVADEQETEHAKQIFDRYKQCGYAAFAQPEVGDPELVHEFDINAKTILFASPLVGG